MPGRTGILTARQGRSLSEHVSLVALTRAEKIVGHDDIDANGYLDRLYVHKDFQRRGGGNGALRPP